MDIELLRTFLEVRKTRHFGKAAENLYLTQAAVSARIKQLERTLGSHIFTRYRNNLQLTAAGERLIPHAEALVNAWEAAKQDLLSKKPYNQKLALGANSGLWDLLLQQVLLDVHQRFTRAALKADALSDSELLRKLIERTLDLALMYDAPKTSELTCAAITSIDLVLVSSAEVDHEQPIDYVAVDWGASFRGSIEPMQRQTPLLSTASPRIALSFLLSAPAMAYLPATLITPYLQNKQLTVVAEAPQLQRTIFACYHSENRYSTQLEQIITMLRETALQQQQQLISIIGEQQPESPIQA